MTTENGREHPKNLPQDSYNLPLMHDRVFNSQFIVDIASIIDDLKRLEEFAKLTANQKLEYLSYDAVAYPSQVDGTREEYERLFGNGKTYNTPSGPVRMGEHQYEKLVAKNRTNLMGHIIKTLSEPSAIIEHADENEKTTKKYVKSFYKIDECVETNRYFVSIVIDADAHLVSISNHLKRKNGVLNTIIKNGTPTFISNGFYTGTPTSAPNGNPRPLHSVDLNVPSASPKVNGTFQVGELEEQANEQLKHGGYPVDSVLKPFKDDV